MSSLLCTPEGLAENLTPASLTQPSVGGGGGGGWYHSMSKISWIIDSWPCEPLCSQRFYSCSTLKPEKKGEGTAQAVHLGSSAKI